MVCTGSSCHNVLDNLKIKLRFIWKEKNSKISNLFKVFRYYQSRKREHSIFHWILFWMICEMIFSAWYAFGNTMILLFNRLNCEIEKRTIYNSDKAFSSVYADRKLYGKKKKSEWYLILLSNIYLINYYISITSIISKTINHVVFADFFKHFNELWSVLVRLRKILAW